MRIRNIIIQLGFMVVFIPLLILLFNYLAQEIAPVIHGPEFDGSEPGNNIQHRNMGEVLKVGIKYQSFRIHFIYFGALAGLIAGRTAYHLWRNKDLRNSR